MIFLWATLGLLGLVLAKQPNILFIITDDQDLHMTPTEVMPLLHANVVTKGATLAAHFCTIAVCCPSRATLWTGRAGHNHNVTDVNPPYGGYPKVVSQGWNDNNLFLWMQAAGYSTYYTGKLWNAHTINNYNAPLAKGFNGSDFLLDPFTYNYNAPVMSRNGGAPVRYPGNYSTDLIAQKARDFLTEAQKHDQPWFLTVAPIAPHSVNVVEESSNSRWFGPPVPAVRHAHLFKDYKIPRDESFNKPIKGAPGWPGQLFPMKNDILSYHDEFQRLRLRSLVAVDEMVGALVQQLNDTGDLNNTFIFYTTDNGFHVSQHAMLPGKSCGYDTDIHIPLYVRGPGIDPGSTLDAVTSHTDIAPTLLKIAGAPLDPNLDGRPVPLDQVSARQGPVEHASIEFWGYGAPEGAFGWKNISGVNYNVNWNNTFKAVRLVSKGYSLYYSVWCSNEAELYDLKRDPFQTKNLLGGGIEALEELIIADRPQEFIVNRLDTLTMVLKSCKGDVCRDPWGYLHPDGKVRSLRDALTADLDGFYAAQPKVAFSRCELGYLLDAEGPQDANVYGGVSRHRRRGETYYGDEFHMWT